MVTGSGNRHAILQDVQKVLNGEETKVVDIRPHQKGESFEELPMDRFADHTRAFVKVEDGCNRRCAYCVIPRARGPVRSRSEISILEELRRLAASGYCEVVLTAISLPSYGKDTGTGLAELVEHAAAVAGIERIRLGSLDPDMLTDDDIRRLAAVPKLCPQFHLSLQSGSSKTLRAMRRPYTTEQYAAVAAKLREAFGEENVSITTDVIVGFPGETEEDFRTTYDFLAGLEPAFLHIFPFSERPGTPAVEMPGKVQASVATRRAAELETLCAKLHGAFCARAVGSEDSVLFESTRRGGMMFGFTGNYRRVKAPYDKARVNTVCRVRLGAMDESHDLMGEIRD